VGEIGHATPFVIGANENYDTQRQNLFIGVIDEIAIHNRALSEAELQSIVASPALPACGATPVPPTVTVPDDITVEATGPAGATVDFSASAVDANGASLATTCTPSSG